MLKVEELVDLVKDPISLSGWAIILGSSSGFGAATSIALAKAGMNIIGVHLDRKSTLPNALEVQKAIQNQGKEAIFYNTNAADTNKIDEIITEIHNRLGRKSIRVLLHSLAFGTLKPYLGEDSVSKEQLEMTLDVMANSLVYWVQKLFKNEMFSDNARIFAMTSIGSSRNWKSYGPVSAAKATIEAHIRQLALELAPYGITANAICAGVTKTPALMKIPGHEDMLEKAEKYNPSRRLTEPVDVANAIMLLSHPASYWITGNTIYVDGGEFLT